jgi:hypothetical protein
VIDPMQMPTVFAYLDPGTGSYLLQVTLAGALGALYAVRHMWSRVKRLFTRTATSLPADDARG